MRSDGSPALTDFGAAQVAAPDGALRTDRAQLLVTTALAADTDRAVDGGARDVLGDDGLAEVLPFLQPAAFDCDTRKALHDQHLDLKALREHDRRHARTPRSRRSSRSQRVTWRSLVKLAVIGFLAYTLISAFANIGIDTIVEEFQDADWSWLLVALDPVAALAGPPGLLDDGGDDARDPVLAGAHAPVRGPVHRARGPQLGGPAGAGGPLLGARRRAERRAPSRSARSTASARS